MRYAILANPFSGRVPLPRKRKLLARAGEILGCSVYGLDVRELQELTELARNLSTRCDVLVVAGGDGTFSHLINVLNTPQVTLAFLPLGTGNALAYALGYPKRIEAIASGIRNAQIHCCDLLLINGCRRALTASVGLEGTSLNLRERYLAHGTSPGLSGYILGFLRAYLFRYRPILAEIRIDDSPAVQIGRLMSLVVAKHPYYGYGVKVLPEADLEDGCLHVRALPLNFVQNFLGLIAALTVGNRTGLYWKGSRMRVRLQGKLPLQADGTVLEMGNRFTFAVLPGELKLALPLSMD